MNMIVFFTWCKTSFIKRGSRWTLGKITSDLFIFSPRKVPNRTHEGVWWGNENTLRMDKYLWYFLISVEKVPENFWYEFEYFPFVKCFHFRSTTKGGKALYEWALLRSTLQLPSDTSLYHSSTHGLYSLSPYRVQAHLYILTRKQCTTRGPCTMTLRVACIIAQNRTTFV